MSEGTGEIILAFGSDSKSQLPHWQTAWPNASWLASLSLSFCICIRCKNLPLRVAVETESYVLQAPGRSGSTNSGCCCRRVVNNAGWQYLTFHNIYLAIHQNILEAFKKNSRTPPKNYWTSLEWSWSMPDSCHWLLKTHPHPVHPALDLEEDAWCGLWLPVESQLTFLRVTVDQPCPVSKGLSLKLLSHSFSMWFSLSRFK